MNPDRRSPAPGLPGRCASRWQLASMTLEFGSLPLLMGIVNVTPDSFSDGGLYLDPERAIEHGLKLEAEGAGMLDVGGESTRPNSAPVDADEELRRIVPVVKGLSRQAKVPVSIDTSKASVARAALAEGAEVINDVTALAGDPDMLALAATSGAGVCAMHMQGTPQTMQKDPRYEDVVEEVIEYLAGRRDVLTAAGVSPERIALDPGIGFGKKTGHCVALLSHAWRLHELGCPVLVGPSRKRFIANVLGLSQPDVTAATIGVALALARQGVQVLRVHDVAAVAQGLRLFAATGGITQGGGPRG